MTRKWLAICDSCGRRFKGTDLRERWDGALVCEADWESRHPQDFPQPARNDPKPLQWSRNDPDLMSPGTWDIGPAINSGTLTDIPSGNFGEGTANITLRISNTDNRTVTTELTAGGYDPTSPMNLTIVTSGVVRNLKLGTGYHADTDIVLNNGGYITGIGGTGGAGGSGNGTAGGTALTLNGNDITINNSGYIWGGGGGGAGGDSTDTAVVGANSIITGMNSAALSGNPDRFNHFIADGIMQTLYYVSGTWYNYRLYNTNTGALIATIDTSNRGLIPSQTKDSNYIIHCDNGFPPPLYRYDTTGSAAGSITTVNISGGMSPYHTYKTLTFSSVGQGGICLGDSSGSAAIILRPLAGRTYEQMWTADNEANGVRCTAGTAAQCQGEWVLNQKGTLTKAYSIGLGSEAISYIDLTTDATEKLCDVSALDTTRPTKAWMNEAQTHIYCFGQTQTHILYKIQLSDGSVTSATIGGSASESWFVNHETSDNTYIWVTGSTSTTQLVFKKVRMSDLVVVQTETVTKLSSDSWVAISCQLYNDYPMYRFIPSPYTEDNLYSLGTPITIGGGGGGGGFYGGVGGAAGTSSGTMSSEASIGSDSTVINLTVSAGGDGGAGATHATEGTAESGGAGGGPGAAGSNTTSGTGGAAGLAIDTGGGTITWVQGQSTPHVKGSVS